MSKGETATTHAGFAISVFSMRDGFRVVLDTDGLPWPTRQEAEAAMKRLRFFSMSVEVMELERIDQ